MDGSHFGFDEEGNVVVMGLRSISFLPHSFGRYTLKTSMGNYSHLPEKFEWLGDASECLTREMFDESLAIYYPGL